jgi:Asp-tRNA(Asn)/Glu-tRNA(Gln) amidotransferase B subunit
LDQDKITKVVDAFFNSLKTNSDEMLETGFSQNTTVEMLHQAVQDLIKQHPKRFEQYVTFFETACMYLQDDLEDPEVPEIHTEIPEAELV